MTDLPDRVRHSELRAGDADRERVAAVLRDAAAEGRIDLTELDERLGKVYAAKTYGELEPIIRDLPTQSSVSFSPDPDSDIARLPSSSGAVALMSEFKRKGRWAVPRIFTCLAFWGGGTIDLREAFIRHGTVKIRAFAIMGGIDVIVPEDANLHVTGLGIMGGFDHGASGAGARGAPVIVVSGLAFWGGVSVKRRASPEEEKRRKAERRRHKQLGD
ncbi:MAG: DUF1707 and DUF2154 domain-containing protein [Micromonosporaceae bacterium]|jgi:hypothetical protein|nr:DUF1707 and DUF2154 domain-containing protein [Micromonosporaceae bacterium]